jgi:hypothetical protein
MSTMDIDLPNGQVLAGVPVGTSKIQVMQAAVKNGLAQWEDFGLANHPTLLGGKPLAPPTGRPVATLVAQHENSKTLFGPNPGDGRPAGVGRGHGPCV